MKIFYGNRTSTFNIRPKGCFSLGPREVRKFMHAFIPSGITEACSLGFPETEGLRQDMRKGRGRLA